MPKNTNYDFIIFFYSVLAGVILSLLCDVFSSLQHHLKLNKICTFILDFAFFCVAGLLTFFLQFIYSNGQIKWFILIGLLCGFIAAKIAISPLNRKLLAFIFKALKSAFKPVRLAFSFIKSKTSAFSAYICNFVGKIIKNSLKSTRKMLYNNCNSSKSLFAKMKAVFCFKSKKKRIQERTARTNGKKKRRQQY